MHQREEKSNDRLRAAYLHKKIGQVDWRSIHPGKKMEIKMGLKTMDSKGMFGSQIVHFPTFSIWKPDCENGFSQNAL